MREVGYPDAHLVNESNGTSFFVYEKFKSQKVFNLGLALLLAGLGGGGSGGPDLSYTKSEHSCVLLRFGPDERLVDYSARNRSKDENCTDKFGSELAGAQEPTAYSALSLAPEAAKQGDAEAQLAYGLRHAEGQERVDWFCRAAIQGHASARFQLGRIRDEGDDHWADAPVSADSVRAYMWYTLALDAGGKQNVEIYREELSATMTPAQIAAGERLAAERTPDSPCPFTVVATPATSTTPVGRSSVVPVDPAESGGGTSRSCTDPAFADRPECRAWLEAWNAAHAEGRPPPSPTAPLRAATTPTPSLPRG